MAYQINKPIGTNAGIVENAYIRIGGYDINKNGNVVFVIDIFKNKESTEVETSYIPSVHPNKLVSNEIGISVETKMATKVKYTKIITKQVDGVDTEMEEEFTKTVSDLSAFESKTIFEIGYEKLGEKLASLYGQENIEIV